MKEKDIEYGPSYRVLAHVPKDIPTFTKAWEWATEQGYNRREHRIHRRGDDKAQELATKWLDDNGVDPKVATRYGPIILYRDYEMFSVEVYVLARPDTSAKVVNYGGQRHEIGDVATAVIYPRLKREPTEEETAALHLYACFMDPCRKKDGEAIAAMKHWAVVEDIEE